MTPEFYNKINVVPRKDAETLFGKIVKDYGSDAKFGTVLDIGCATGNVTIKFFEHFECNNLVAFDKNESMVEFAQINNHRSEINYCVADVADSIIKLKSALKMNEQADVVYSNHCLQCSEQQTVSLSNVLELMRPGAKLYMSFAFWTDIVACLHNFVRNSKWNQQIDEERFMTIVPFKSLVCPDVNVCREQWTKLLSSCGFQNISVSLNESKSYFDNFDDFAKTVLMQINFNAFLNDSDKEECVKNEIQYLRDNYNPGYKRNSDPFEMRYHYCIIAAEK
ncbi:uncharacterized protein B4U80_12818 [Leptotrombidium deliense]|uniref:Methyltransferase domain-containing protein n=1 Tax=Leptotrombidium deliense TaxID=299467 RepID=A0A443SKF9_9ACAR|nr:uncharacterized protein B4U80_12818 [Leptotrombidium deliense]